MKRNFKKCMSGAMAVALLFTATPSKVMAGSVPVSSDNVIEKENVTLSEDDASISNNQEDIDSPDASEENVTLNESVTIADELENKEASDTEEEIETLSSDNTPILDVPENTDISDMAEVNVPETDQAGAGAEDVTASFTDPKFLAVVREELGIKNDAPITKDNCFRVKELDVSEKDIESLAGIENFTNLQRLFCYRNQLKELNISQCANLQTLQCFGNYLKELDVSQCANLQSLNCMRNYLKELDVSQCTNLQELYFGDNQLTTLDISQCANLQELECDGNSLKELRVNQCANLQLLECMSNQLTTLDISQCANLRSLYCSGNPLKELDVSQCANLQTLQCIGNHLKELDVSQCANLQDLNCSINSLKELDVSQCQNLQSLWCIENQLTTLDVSQCANLQTLNCPRNPLEELNVSQCQNLQSLWCRENQLTTLDVSGCPNIVNLDSSESPLLTNLECGHNVLMTLNVNNCDNLRRLNCSNNCLGQLNIEGCGNLVELYCNGNLLSKLSLNGCAGLEKLDCSYNYMESPDDVMGKNENLTGENFVFMPQNERVDVTGFFKDLNFRSAVRGKLGLGENEPIMEHVCAGVTNLYLAGEDIESLAGIECFINLTELNCSSNKLTTLNVSQCPNLSSLDCRNNQLTTLDVSQCPKLKSLYCAYNNMKSPDDVKGKNVNLTTGGTFIFNPQCVDTKKSQNPIVTPSALKLYAGGETQSLKVSNAVGAVTYISSDSKIVKVDADGKVTPVSKGTATITVKASGDDSYKEATLKISVTVDSKPVTLKTQNPKVEPKSLKLYVDGKAQSLKVSDAIGTVTYISSNSKVAKVDANGKVMPVSKGTAIITVKASGDSSYKEASLKINVTVQNKPVTLKTQNPRVKPKSLKLYTGGEAKSLRASNAKGKVTYVSSKPKVAKVNSHGKVMPVSKGTATITIKAAGNKSYKAAAVQVKVTVYGRPAAVKKVKATRTNKNRSLKVTWKKTPSAFGYIIKYSYHKNMKNSRTAQIFKDGVASKTLKNIKPKKAVYVQVQAYAKKGGLTIPGDWSKIIKSEPAKEKAVSGNKTAK